MPRKWRAASMAVSGSAEIARFAWMPASAPRRATAAAISCGVPIKRPRPTMEKITMPGAVSSTSGENEEASASKVACSQDGANTHANMAHPAIAIAMRALRGTISKSMPSKTGPRHSRRSRFTSSCTRAQDFTSG